MVPEMIAPTSKTNLKSLILLWAGLAVVMAAVVIWGAIQPQDPLSNYVHTDKARHILAFGAIGLCAGLMPSAPTRIMALGGVLVFGLLVEIIQIPVPDREASMSDLLASTAGAFGGFGGGAAAGNLFETVRGKIRAGGKAALPQG